jgi:hypothetical protein
MKDGRNEVNNRPLWFHWLVDSGFVLLVTLPSGLDWQAIPLAAVAGALLTPLTRRWERRAGQHT